MKTGRIEAIITKKNGENVCIEDIETIYLLATKEYEIMYTGDLQPKQQLHDCRDCKKWIMCPCGLSGHVEGTSIGFSIGECKDFDPKE